ncbi:MAG TPA: isoprenylcysteine carboxylmethyltransferase family protein [Pyrinomonadaceae bacterium]|nr:isoprenylcysteine carboxylmethyltransferase family protein [Pyrinomonadaceae bacterium]
MTLSTKALLSVFVLALVIVAIIFPTAGTIHYWEAWTYVAIFFCSSLLTTVYLIKNDPDLLQRRMRGGPLAEKRAAQRVIMLLTSLAFLGLLVVPALDRRFGWSTVSTPIVLSGDLLVALGLYFIFRVYRENTYTSATIEVAANQKVIDTGPYSRVRHPMYASALLYLVGTPLALGSYWGLLPFIALIPFLMWRLTDEEKMLARDLEGYEQYRQRVRYRLVPRIW